MSWLAWNDMFSVGVQEIDIQHKRLFEIANRLNDAMRSHRDREALAGVLNDLMAYTQSHFSYEERLMEKYRYPKVEPHTLEHRKLVQIVGDFQTKFAQGDADLTADVMTLLRDWLSKHIMSSDRALGKALNALGVH